MPDEEFDVLGEDELALLTRRFERLHENWVNMRRNTRTCFQCSKPGPSGILPGYSCKEGRRQTPTRIPL
jgi:hypothetical protein